ncbi:protein of unknown function [Serratia sp. Tan611]|nr:protein of unknown function [Serratia sp. Tan611]
MRQLETFIPFNFQAAAAIAVHFDSAGRGIAAPQACRAVGMQQVEIVQVYSATFRPREYEKVEFFTPPAALLR